MKLFDILWGILFKDGEENLIGQMKFLCLMMNEIPVKCFLLIKFGATVSALQASSISQI